MVIPARGLNPWPKGTEHPKQALLAPLRIELVREMARGIGQNSRDQDSYLRGVFNVHTPCQLVQLARASARARNPALEQAGSATPRTRPDAHP